MILLLTVELQSGKIPRIKEPVFRARAKSESCFHSFEFSCFREGCKKLAFSTEELSNMSKDLDRVFQCNICSRGFGMKLKIKHKML